MSGKTLKQLGSHIKKQLGKSVTSFDVCTDEAVLKVKREDVYHVLHILRDDPECQFKQLMDITATDWIGRLPDRFDVVYHMLSLRHNIRIRVIAETDEATPIPSVTSLFHAAIWAEREVFDMYGISFEGNPDQRRILTDYGFEGHPLRKDFPLTGFVEVRYDSEQQAVVYEPVKLQQDFRRFDFESPWEAMETVQLPGDEKAMKQKFGTIDYRARAKDMMKEIGSK
jgi:NADH-quinone oxidoreductase subunit C